ncbi:ketosteroid isomerase [Pedobacter mucosus]|uniref:ketosteroid isomerase n=1 Tax=Pedobacter mucosus TaxID=2895286 RepID=UPI001EE415AF|nr:ketosteroid isomerase [Pedobacter mucosus]UKT64834.1 ketosteroid isomerase [Pedobacter mucosus]
MENQYINLINKAYSAFNKRNINDALSTMDVNVQWSKAWEGGYISGHKEITEYWTRQWKELNPKVEPVGFTKRANEVLEVMVHQHVLDLQGAILFDGMVKHVYTFQNGLIMTMDIELVDSNR